MVVFENFREKPDQKFIDGAYRSLEPQTIIEAKYDFVNPSKIRQAITEGLLKAGNLTELKEGLASVIQVSKLLTVRITPNESVYDIEADLSDLKSGESIMKFSRRNVSAGDMGETLEMLSREAFEL